MSSARRLADQTEVGRMRLRNRLVATAHGTGLVVDGLPLAGDAEYWRRLAAGGASMLISGGTIVAPESAPRRRNVVEAWRPEVVAAFADRVDGIHAEGAAAVCQLVHLGRETLLAEGYYAPVAPAAVRSPREPTAPRALTEAELGRLAEAHGACTANAVEAGFDGVELHAAHGYLANQFLSRSSNPARDLDARLAAVRQIAGAMRAAARGAAVGVRVSVEGAGEGGLGLAELCAVLPQLDRLFDWINVTVGVRGTYVRDMATVRPPLLDAVAAIRAQVDRPLLISSALRDVEQMDEALRYGADLVGVARPLIADPDLPRKVLAGREREVRPCVSCNEDCRTFDPQLLCTVNPDLAPAGRRRRPAAPLLLARAEPPREEEPRVAVIGAGPGGLECAYRLARAGAAVALFDERPAIGGHLGLAASAPHRRGWRRLLDFYAAALERHSVDVRLGTRVDGDGRLPDGFDEVVVAVGSEEVLPDVDGIEAATSASAAIAAGPQWLSGVERLVVVDDGFGWWPGVSAVELGVAAGVPDIVVVTPGTAFAAAIPHESRAQLLPRLRKSRVEVRALLRVASVASDGVEVAAVPGAAVSRLPADAVIVVGERRPLPWAVGPHDGRSVRAIGDCVVPRRVAHAIAEGAAAAADITVARRSTTLGPPPSVTA